MNITFALVIFGWKLGSFDVNVDLGGDIVEIPIGVAAKPTVIDKISDYFAGRYIERRLTKRSKEMAA
jgi:hypothetical protein